MTRSWSREIETRVGMARRGLSWEEIAERRGLAHRSIAWKSVRRWLDAEEWEQLCRDREAAGRSPWKRRYE